MTNIEKTLDILDEVEVGSIFGSGYALLLDEFEFLNRRFRGGWPDQPLREGDGRILKKSRAKMREVKRYGRKGTEIPSRRGKKRPTEEVR